MAETTTQITRATIKAPIQEVWDTLTKHGEPLPFFGAVMHTTALVKGGQMHMRSPNGKYTSVVGEFLDIDPPNRYSTTFRFTNYDDDPPCKVTHELKEVDGGVEYTLTSDEIPVGTKTERDMKQGGDLIVGTLKSLIETGKPPLKARFILTMIKLTSWLTPKRCLASNWPME